MTETNTTPSAETNKYAGLENKELVFIFYKMREFVTNLDENLSQKKLRKEVETPVGKGVAFISVSDEQVEKFKSSEHYQVMHRVLSKLEPIVEVIEECDESSKEFANDLR
jgi:hypothetical protein